MAFSKSSLPLLLGPFINSFIMICESMLSVSQDGLLREMLLSKYRLQIFDYIEINWFFLVGGTKIIPPYKTLLPFSRAFSLSPGNNKTKENRGIVRSLIKHWVGGLFPPASYAP